jgi:hypothetical protein
MAAKQPQSAFTAKTAPLSPLEMTPSMLLG